MNDRPPLFSSFFARRRRPAPPPSDAKETREAEPAFPLPQKRLVALLLFSLIPLLTYGILFQIALKQEQEAAFERVYRENASSLLRSLEAQLQQSSEFLTQLSRNDSLRRLLQDGAEETLSQRSRRETLSQIEAGIWYQLSRKRPYYRKIRIYTLVSPRSLGYFIRPASKLPPFRLAEWQKRNVFGEWLDLRDSEPSLSEKKNDLPPALYFVQRLSYHNGTREHLLAYIVAEVDIQNCLHTPGDRDTGFPFELILNDHILYARPSADAEEKARIESASTKANAAAAGAASGHAAPPENASGRTFPTPDSRRFLRFDFAGHRPDLRLRVYLARPNFSLRLISPLLAFAASTLLTLAVVFFLVLVLKKAHRKMEHEQKENEALRLRVLRSQLNPHFLYNILSMINWKAKYAHRDDISDLVTELSQFYRLSLNHGREMISLRDELKSVETYLSLKQKLLDAPLHYQIDLPPHTENLLILHFLLQPLVENALIHGLAALGRPASLRIVILAEQGSLPFPSRKKHLPGLLPRIRRARPAAGVTENENARTLLWICVLDDGRGLSSDALAKLANDQSYGLKNVARRLSLHYGHGAALALISGTQFFSPSEAPLQGNFTVLPDGVRELAEEAQSSRGGCLALLRLPLPPAHRDTGKLSDLDAAGKS